MYKPALKFSRSLSENQLPKVLPTSERLRREIVTILGDKNRVMVSDIQTILGRILSSYDVTGFAVYSELQDMINENILRIDNQYLNNSSLLSFNK
ncbi:MAG: hypothetical protein K1X86_07720 [Ignavibacteria bacterium]|nr:hypothetical protein [Ignavibacteria bacterium]